MNNSGDAEVCLVDDDSSVLRSMQYLLASDGIAVRAFNKPEEFLAHENRDRPEYLEQILAPPMVPGEPA